MIGLFFKSFAMLFVWTGLLMVFTSAGGSPLMLGELLLALCGALFLAARAPTVSGARSRRGVSAAVRSRTSSRSSPSTSSSG